MQPALYRRLPENPLAAYRDTDLCIGMAPSPFLHVRSGRLRLLPSAIEQAAALGFVVPVGRQGSTGARACHGIASRLAGLESLVEGFRRAGREHGTEYPGENFHFFGAVLTAHASTRCPPPRSAARTSPACV